MICAKKYSENASKFIKVMLRIPWALFPDTVYVLQRYRNYIGTIGSAERRIFAQKCNDHAVDSVNVKLLRMFIV